jgi:hypothetical protein
MLNHALRIFQALFRTGRGTCQQSGCNLKLDGYGYEGLREGIVDLARNTISFSQNSLITKFDLSDTPPVDLKSGCGNSCEYQKGEPRGLIEVRTQSK